MDLPQLQLNQYDYWNKYISISDYHLLYIIRYTWSSSDEKLFFLNNNLRPLDDRLKKDMFPGLRAFLHFCILEKRRNDFAGMEKEMPNVLLTSESRGPQSFAFGHYMVDILPILNYLQMFQVSPLSKQPPLLIYNLKDWHIDLHNIFGIPTDSVFQLDKHKSILATNTDSGQKIQLYAVNAKLLNIDRAYMRNFFSSNKIVETQITNDLPLRKMLIMNRKNLGHRPVRWINQDEFISMVKIRDHDSYACVDPARVLPSELINYTRKATIIISSPGSSAYIPLHISKVNTFVVMPISFKCDHKEAWNYTLSMFNHYSDKIILVSNTNQGLDPSTSAWDKPFNINEEDLLKLVDKLVSITQQKSNLFNSNMAEEKDPSRCSSRCILYCESLTVSLPGHFKRFQKLLAS